MGKYVDTIKEILKENRKEGIPNTHGEVVEARKEAMRRLGGFKKTSKVER